jgi:hypothetical protein
MVSRDHRKELRIRSALNERDTRVACLISESLRNAFDLVEEQSTTVLQAMLDASVEKERTGQYRVQHRRKLRDALREYLEYALQEAHKREREQLT